MSDRDRAQSRAASDKRRRLLEVFLGRRGLTIPRAGPVMEHREQGSYEPSFAQQRLWFLNQLEPDDGLYNMTGAWCLYGSLDVDRLARSIREIVRRHESLRTRFVTVGGEPRAMVEREVELPVPVVDMGDVPEPEQDPRVRDAIAAQARQPFNLEQAPLIRTVLLRTGARLHVLIVVMHHICSDGHSFLALRRELQSLYAGRATGAPVLLPELPIQYGDYACWQWRRLEEEKTQAQLAYWKEQLAKLAPLELPADLPRPPVQTHRGARVRSVLPPSVADSLTRVSRDSRCTLFMTLLAGFGVLLHRLAGQEDICIGVPVASRNTPEVENLIGLFVDTLVMRVSFADNPTFREILSRVRQVCLDAYAHQDVPFERLVQELAPRRDASRNPLFQVFFNMNDPDDEPFELHDLTVRRVRHDDVQAKFDLTLYTAARKDGIGFDLVYNRDLFEHARMVELLGQYEHLLTQVARQPDARIGELSLVTASAERVLPDPRQELPRRWEGEAHGKVPEHAKTSPCRQAIVDDAGTWTYAQLDRAVRSVASHLRAQGITGGDIVAIYGDRSASLVVSLLGVLEAGGVFILLDPAHPPARLRDCLAAARPRAWLQADAPAKTAEGLDDIVGVMPLRLGVSVNSQACAELAAAADGAARAAVDPEAPAYIAFTSGTSCNRPRGVVGTHRPLSHFLHWHCTTFGLTKSDRFAMLSGLSHDPLLRDVLTPLWLGATLCIPGREDMESPRRLVEWMRGRQITVAHVTAALMESLALDVDGTEETARIPSLRRLFFGGDRLTARHVAEAGRLAPHATCVNFYGTTETPQAMAFCIASTAKDGTGPARIDVPLGRGIEGAQLLLLNGAGRRAGVGELAEICVRSPYLCRGYLHDPASTAERFTPNPFRDDPNDRIYKTGDLGRYRPDGSVEFCGRSDRQVKIRGFRVEPAAIEEALCSHPAVRQAAVTVVEDSHLDKALAACVVYDGSVSTLSLRAHLRKMLPEYMVPSHFLKVDTLPLTPNGKIDFTRLPLPGSVPNAADPPARLCTAMERQVAEVWQEVTGLASISRHDNFFDIGGHSLLAVKAVSLLDKRLGLRVPLRDFFNQTLAEFAACCEQRLHGRTACG